MFKSVNISSVLVCFAVMFCCANCQKSATPQLKNTEGVSEDIKNNNTKQYNATNLIEVTEMRHRGCKARE